MTDTSESLGTTTGAQDEAEAKLHRDHRRLEIWKPPADGMHGYLWVEIVDFEGIDPSSIIKEQHQWRVCCHIWLYGDIWKLVCGELCCEICIKPCYPEEGQPSHYRLEDLTGKPLCHDFEGCKNFTPGSSEYRGYTYHEFCADVPAGRLPAGADGKPKVYDWTATISFKDECGEYGVISGFDKGCLQVYRSQY